MPKKPKEPKAPKTTKSKPAKDLEKEKKHKKIKDKDAPKRAMGAFFCYQKVRREQVIKENPSLDNKQVVSVFLKGVLENVRRMESAR